MIHDGWIHGQATHYPDPPEYTLVPCPTCSAPIDKPCSSDWFSWKTLETIGIGTHAKRRELYWFRKWKEDKHNRECNATGPHVHFG